MPPLIHIAGNGGSDLGLLELATRAII
ncbi:hypothetical protein D6833_02240, partial [Candidatus Parcubacteria bacterium]